MGKNCKYSHEQEICRIFAVRPLKGKRGSVEEMGREPGFRQEYDRT